MWNFDFSLRRQIATWKKWKDQNANGRNWIQASLGPIVFKCKMRGRNENKELDWSWPSETSMMEQKKSKWPFDFYLPYNLNVSYMYLCLFCIFLRCMTTAGYMQWMSNDIGFTFIVPFVNDAWTKTKKKDWSHQKRITNSTSSSRVKKTCFES